VTVSSTGLQRLGGISFFAGGALFLARSILEFLAGPPPSSGAEILVWMASRQSLLAANVEISFFAAMCLIPAVIALYDRLASTHGPSAAVGCGSIAVTIPIFLLLVILQGRLVFPVFELRVHTVDIAELAVALYYGGLHAIAIVLAIATLVLSLAMRRATYGRAGAGLGLATAALDLLGAYPESIGPVLTLVGGVAFAAWFGLVGLALTVPVAGALRPGAAVREAVGPAPGRRR